MRDADQPHGRSPGTSADAYAGVPVLITGGAGFIGSHLAAHLAGLGAQVRVLDDLSTGRAENLDGVDVAFHEGSILDDGLLRDAVAGCRIIFHEAAMVSVPQSVEEPDRCAAINIEGTERVLAAARDLGVRRVVFASSAAVYGDEPRLPSHEGDPVVCCSPYAASKAAGEALIAASGRCYDLTTVSLRYFNIFGPRQDPKSAYAAAIAAFIDAFENERTPRVFGDGLQTRDFVYVDNVVHANLLAGCVDDPGGMAINVGTGAACTLLDVLAALERIFDREAPPSMEPARAGDVMHSRPDVSRAREVLGYEPMVGFEDGLARMLRA